MRQEVLFRDKNFLFNGDNLQILRYRIASESVDLIYLDPPFNSNQDYSIIFKEQNEEGGSEAQIKAFGDTWKWGPVARDSYRDAIENGPVKLADVMEAFHTFLGPSNMLAYLAMMAPRLVELHRVLRDTGSIYLHCDPTASHYLRVLMDAVFDPTNFRTEIVWKRSSAHSDSRQGRRQHGRLHDVLLFYTKSKTWTWNPIHVPHEAAYIESHYRLIEPETGRRYQLTDITGPGGAAKGNPRYEVMGVTRYWRYSRQRMEELIDAGRIIQPRPGAVPRYKRYLDEMPGVQLQDIWSDIPPVNSQAIERLGYPTQKPEALLQRIITTSSNEGDTVLDPFCGCGTTIAAAQLLKRRWVGIDITQVAINVIQERLRKQVGKNADDTYTLVRDPVSVADALSLARQQDKYEFQWWVLDRLGAVDTIRKRGKDKGVDGRINFYDDESGPSKKIVISVKGGKTGPADVRDLRGVMERDKATIGVFVTIKKPTRDMELEAFTADVYHSDEWNRDYDRLQILTVDNIINGKRIDYPSGEFHSVSGFRPRVRPKGRVAPGPEAEKVPQARAAASKARGAKSVSPRKAKSTKEK
jgi:DNA modification methylase